MSRDIEFDVALSYAGEQRKYVKEVSDILKGKGIKVFFDKDYEVEMWGKDLPELLKEVFYKSSQYCMMFISKDYISKAWPTYEAKSAIAREVEQFGNYILPVRFDDSEVPGLLPTIKYIEAQGRSPNDVANSFLELKEKLSGNHSFPR